MGGPETEGSKVGMDVRRAGDHATVIDIAGELTGASEAALMEAYQAASGAETRAIILNFSPLEYMNSTGIGLLVTLLVRAQRQGQRMLAYGLSEHYRQILALTRIDEAIGVMDTEADAIAAAA